MGLKKSIIGDKFLFLCSSETVIIPSTLESNYFVWLSNVRNLLWGKNTKLRVYENEKPGIYLDL